MRCKKPDLWYYWNLQCKDGMATPTPSSHTMFQRRVTASLQNGLCGVKWQNHFWLCTDASYFAGVTTVCQRCMWSITYIFVKKQSLPQRMCKLWAWMSVLFSYLFWVSWELDEIFLHFHELCQHLFSLVGTSSFLSVFSADFLRERQMI